MTPREDTPKTGFAVPRENYKLLLIGLAIITVGFILMAGGGSDDPNVFNEEALFGFRRTSLASILVIFGFAFEVYAIMKKPKAKDSQNDRSDRGGGTMK